MIVIGLPMYNFGVPSTLKAYFDHVARAGVTFRYTATGPVGLLTGKKAYVFATRGGLYAGTPLDTQTAYVRDFLRFLGIADVEFVYAEGLAVGAERKDAALRERAERDRTPAAAGAADRRVAAEQPPLGRPRGCAARRPPSSPPESNEEHTMTIRTVQRIIRPCRPRTAPASSCGAASAQSPATRLDPFLMLDQFSTDDADDYIAGFPSHPHRGFETVTYMLDGHMLHEDHLGHAGDLKSGGVQWMTAGRGIIHSEMPQQEAGRMRGFQLWINLPAREKMKPAAYRDIEAAEIPVVALPGGGRGQGDRRHADRRAVSRRRGRFRGVTTDPLYLDVALPARARFTQPIAAGHNAFLYVFEGSVAVGPAAARAHASPRTRAGVLSDGDAVEVTGGAGGRALPAARRPAAARAGRPVRTVRDEHARGNRAGDPRLPER